VNVRRFALAASLVLAACAAEDEDLGVDGSTSATTSATGASTTSTSVTTSSGASGSGGAGGEWSGPSTSGAGAGSTTSTGAGGEGGSEPGLPTELTVVNGVSDYAAIRLCFLDYPDQANTGDSPWPPEAQGLAYSRGRVVPIDSVVPSGKDVRPYVIAGDLSAASGKTCGEVIAMAPPVIVTALPVIPKPVFTSGKSLLFVPSGCAGGAGHTDAFEKLACGQSYSLANPSLNVIVVAMSRETDPSGIGLQVVHAAAGMLTVDFRLTPGIDAPVDLPVAASAALGAVAPDPPLYVSAIDLGTVIDAKIGTYIPNDVFATSITPFSKVFPNSDLLPEDLEEGSTYALVAVGAYPGIVPGLPSTWWRALSYALVRTDPP
jgi:hypothetical protein